MPLAYQKTFQWIFRSTSESTAWDNFTSYLSRTDINTPYFINGKAGSGKSTLMKFIRKKYVIRTSRESSVKRMSRG